MLIRAIWYFISSLWSVEQLKPDSANRYPKVEVEISAHQEGPLLDKEQRDTECWAENWSFLEILQSQVVSSEIIYKKQQWTQL